MTTARTLLAISTVAAALACGDGRRVSGAPPSGIGPDAVLLRTPLEGGTARAHRVGSDSVLWQSRTSVPALESALGFDDFLGLVMVRARDGRIVSVDLRLGSVATLGEERMRGSTVAEGSAVFGLDSTGRVLRLTPVATWKWEAPAGEPMLLPTPDGSLLVFSSNDLATRVRRLIPPEAGTLDSAETPRVRLAVRTQAGDRVWLSTDEGIVALRARDLTEALRLDIGDPVVAMTPTPSGDRVFIATDDNELRVIDRYAERERNAVDLPLPSNALRMDPDGHYLLARVAGVDSVYVVSIGTNRVVNTVGSAWRADLPLVTPDGGVLLARGPDAVLVDAETGRERFRYGGGAADAWTLVRWNGFRPRAKGLDRPVEFEEFAADSAAADSAVAALIASRYGDLAGIGRAEPLGDPGAQAPAARTGGEREMWTVSFATLLTEDRARGMADTIVVDGKRARVVAGNRDGVPVWRVLLGPYDTRREAERAGMSSGHSYWVFEGVP